MKNNMAKNKILEIKKLVKHECETLGFGLWFYDSHLLAVEKFSKMMLKKLPKANKEIVLLGVWLHDLQRIRVLRGHHAETGAREAEKVMENFKYDKSTIKRVKEIILSHSCNSRVMPKTIEAKILASADAMSHYVNDFFLEIAVAEQRDVKNFKAFVLEKLDRNYNKKIYFNFAKKIIKKRHDIVKSFFTMN